MEKDVIKFLIRAKKNTYAGKGNESKSTRPNSHDLIYTEDDLLYIDTYLGGLKFSGEEALWHKNIPFWSMNYIGRVLGKNFNGDFLKEALSLVTIDQPYRGPLFYKSGNYEYTCHVNGTIDWFNGSEIITHKKIKIYECQFHGGSVK